MSISSNEVKEIQEPEARQGNGFYKNHPKGTRSVLILRISGINGLGIMATDGSIVKKMPYLLAIQQDFFFLLCFLGR